MLQKVATALKAGKTGSVSTSDAAKVVSAAVAPVSFDPRNITDTGGYNYPCPVGVRGPVAEKP